MVFKKKTPEVPEVVPAPTPVPEPVPTPVIEEAPVVETFVPENPEPAIEPQMIPTPVFLTQADINKMIYDNNVMLRHILEVISEESAEQ